MTQEKYNMILKNQKYKCSICKIDNPKSIDHNHLCCPSFEKSKKDFCGLCTRGVLCQNCNDLLGKINDSVDILNQMIIYLKKKPVMTLISGRGTFVNSKYLFPDTPFPKMGIFIGQDKVCPVCRDTKHISNFKLHKHGRNPYCNDCTVIQNRATTLRIRYGMYLEEYEELYTKQEGKCAICLLTPKTILAINFILIIHMRK